MSKFKWTVEIEIEERWVADGADITQRALEKILGQAFPYCYSHEVRGKVLSSPSDESIAEAQGYKTVEEFRRNHRKETA